MINLDAAFLEQFFEVTKRQSEPELPAHRQQDHSGGNRNPVNAEDNVAGCATQRQRFIGTPSSPARAPSTQQSRDSNAHTGLTQYVAGV